MKRSVFRVWKEQPTSAALFRLLGGMKTDLSPKHSVSSAQRFHCTKVSYSLLDFLQARFWFRKLHCFAVIFSVREVGISGGQKILNFCACWHDVRVCQVAFKL